MGSEDASAPYDAAGAEALRFTFRNAAQYGTGGAFKLYQAPWQYMVAAGANPLLPADPAPWIEEPVNETYPWPGKENYRAMVYVTLQTETNFDENGDPKPRSELSDQPGTFLGKGLNEYPVVS